MIRVVVGDHEAVDLPDAVRLQPGNHEGGAVAVRRVLPVCGVEEVRLARRRAQHRAEPRPAARAVGVEEGDGRLPGHVGAPLRNRKPRRGAGKEFNKLTACATRAFHR